MEAVRCYASQFEGARQAGEVYPNGEPLYDMIAHYAAYYGALIRTRYGEPYFTTEMMRVDDVRALEHATFFKTTKSRTDRTSRWMSCCTSTAGVRSFPTIAGSSPLTRRASSR